MGRQIVSTCLVRIEHPEPHINQLFFFRPTHQLLPAHLPNLDDLEFVATTLLTEVLDPFVQRTIDFWSTGGTDDEIQCPEGYIELPADIWMCKLNKQICFLQCAVQLNNQSNFFQKCHAPIERKVNIFKTIENGKYKGFHHMPGRYLCAACEDKAVKKRYSFYHYQWEFAELDFAIGKSYEATEKLLTKIGLPTFYVSVPICSNCCFEFAEKYLPEQTSNLKLIKTTHELTP